MFFLKGGWAREGVYVGNMDKDADHFRSREEDDRKEGRGGKGERGKERELTMRSDLCSATAAASREYSQVM